MRGRDDPIALGDRTTADFGEQWTRFPDHAGWYGSLDLLRDMFGPLLDPLELRGTRVAEIGSGTGRIVQMLLEAGAAHVTALEPSDAFSVLEANTRHYGGRVLCQRRRGEEINPGGAYDYVLAIGVLHHIPDPAPVVAAACRALKPGGRMAVWLYGREGNGLYLTVASGLRAVTTRLPHALLAALSAALTVPLSLYVAACRVLPLPLRSYMREVVAKLSWEKRRLVVYDQLNPAHAKYYRGDEARALLADAGFTGIQMYHRHGYSWALMARRSPSP